MSELRSAIEGFRCDDVSGLPDARIEEEFGELQAAVEALEAERLRRLAEIDRRRSFERDGYLSTAAWLAGRFRVAWSDARRGVTLARGLDRMPRVRRAFHDGAFSLSAVRVLGEAQQAEPDGFRRRSDPWSMLRRDTRSPTSAGWWRAGATPWSVIEWEPKDSMPCSGRADDCTPR